MSLEASMVLASHIIFAAYGFWLPNDPRGSWSQWVASWELLKHGRATKVDTYRSMAHVPYDVEARRAAKSALKYLPVRFTGLQARAIARGISNACDDAGYVVRACAIQHDHVHAVVRRHQRQAEVIARHFKAAATRELRRESLHPFDNGNERVPAAWAVGCWKRYLDDGADIVRAINYVNQNPIKAGHKSQNWNFVVPLPTPDESPH
jgi:REP element-mobilizing transposase RayT